MSSTTIPNNGVLTEAVTYADAFGNTVAAPAGVTFESSDTSVATVSISATGEPVITPVANGTTTITASTAAGPLSGSLTITVSDPVAASVVFGAGSLSPLPIAAPASSTTEPAAS